MLVKAALAAKVSRYIQRGLVALHAKVYSYDPWVRGLNPAATHNLFFEVLYELKGMIAFDELLHFIPLLLKHWRGDQMSNKPSLSGECR